MIKLANFIIDCTPPHGTPVGFGIGKKTDGVRDKLYLRGIILDDGRKKSVIASMDYCGLMNSAYDNLVSSIADAVGASGGFTYVTHGMCNNESVEKIHSFISACKEVEQMLLKGISRQEIGKLVSLGGRKKFWDNWPPGK